MRTGHRQWLYSSTSNLYFNNKKEAFIKKATEYLNEYKDDINMRFMRAKAYRFLKKYDEAISDLKYILNIEINDYALSELFFLYYYLNMYNEALELIPLLYKTRAINAYSITIAEQVIKKQLNIPMNIKRGDKCDYIRSQISNYNKELAIKHISEHKPEYADEEVLSTFNSNIDLQYLFNFVRDNIKAEEKVNIADVLEIHYFSVPNVGVCEENICSYIRVVVVPNTSDIIAMYPTNDVESEYVVPLNCDCSLLFREKEKTKTLSRIDRFNLRQSKKVE